MPIKPSESEEKYFMEQEMKLRLEKQAEAQRAMAEAEKIRLKELHWMRCPKCGQKLATENYGKVEVDVCPCCKGLWLDANELDAIIKGSAKGGFSSFLRILGAG